jgi:hypothetical protein
MDSYKAKCGERISNIVFNSSYMRCYIQATNIIKEYVYQEQTNWIIGNEAFDLHVYVHSIGFKLANTSPGVVRT